MLLQSNIVLVLLFHWNLAFVVFVIFLFFQNFILGFSFIHLALCLPLMLPSLSYPFFRSVLALWIYAAIQLQSILIFLTFWSFLNLQKLNIDSFCFLNVFSAMILAIKLCLSKFFELLCGWRVEILQKIWVKVTKSKGKENQATWEVKHLKAAHQSNDYNRRCEQKWYKHKYIMTMSSILPLRTDFNIEVKQVEERQDEAKDKEGQVDSEPSVIYRTYCDHRIVSSLDYGRTSTHCKSNQVEQSEHNYPVPFHQLYALSIRLLLQDAQ